MSGSTDRPNVIPWPPLIYVGLALAALALHWVAPLPWPEGGLRWVLTTLGLVAAAAALALDISAAFAFRRHRTTIMPNRAATALITSGPFALSRNPIYVANTLLVGGLGLVSGITWLVIAALLGALLTRKLAIEREESHLAARFGADWQAYAARTPRWLFFR